MPIRVLFVCAGNYCRSPMAEAVFKDLVDRTGLADQFEIDSVGTHAYFAGEPAHPGTQQVLSDHGLAHTGVSRRVVQLDLLEADYVIAMDVGNLHDLQAMARGLPRESRLHLLLDFTPNLARREVPDPYYTDDFAETYRLVEAGCRGLLAHIREERGI